VAKSSKIRQDAMSLSIEQLNAIDLLVTGLSDREVAEKVGVARQTITNWRLYHPVFQAELNRKRKEIWGVSGDRLRSLLPKALDRLEKTLVDDSNPNAWRVAIELLRATGLYANDEHDSGGIGEDDAREIAKRHAMYRRKAESDGGLDSLVADLSWTPSDAEIDSAMGDLLQKANSEQSQKTD